MHKTSIDDAPKPFNTLLRIFRIINSYCHWITFDLHWMVIIVISRIAFSFYIPTDVKKIDFFSLKASYERSEALEASQTVPRIIAENLRFHLALRKATTITQQRLI